jgi:hypothetical protein
MRQLILVPFVVVFASCGGDAGSAAAGQASAPATASTTRVANTTRQVGLQVLTLTPAEALDSLAQAFLSKGWQATESSAAGGRGLTQSYFKGGAGRGMTTVVASGGTYVTVVTSLYDEATAARSGFTSVLNITINTK